jgi:hypothetical protein
MTEKKKGRVEDSKVSTSVEFTMAVYLHFKERGYEPDIALQLTQITVLDLRLYDIMQSIDTIVNNS